MLFKEFLSTLYQSSDAIQETTALSLSLEKYVGKKDIQEEHASDYLNFHNLDKNGHFIVDTNQDEAMLLAHQDDMRLYFKNFRRFFSSHFTTSNPMFIDVFYDNNETIQKEFNQLENMMKRKNPYRTGDDEDRNLILSILMNRFGYNTVLNTDDINVLFNSLIDMYGDTFIADYLKPQIQSVIKELNETIDELERVAMEVTPEMLLHRQMSIPYTSIEMIRDVKYKTYQTEYTYEFLRDFYESILPSFAHIGTGSTFLKSLESEDNYYHVIDTFFVVHDSLRDCKQIIRDFSGGIRFSSITNKLIVQSSIDAQFELYAKQ